MNRGLSIVRKMTLCAMFIVMNVVLTAVPRYFETAPIFAFNRITLGPSVVILSSILLGPLYGFLTGAAGDALGWLLFPNSGAPLNLAITLLYGLLGILPSILIAIFKKQRPKGKRMFFLFGLLAGMVIGLLTMLWFTPSFDVSFEAWGWNLIVTKISISVIVVACTTALCLFVGKLEINYQKAILEVSQVPSPTEIGFIATICEVAFMVLLKPLCFVLYAKVVAGLDVFGYYGITYELLVLLSIMFAFIDIPLNTAIVLYGARLSDKLLKRGTK